MYSYARVLSVLACFLSLRAYMSCMLTVLKHLTFLRACVLGIHFCLIYFILEKLNSKNLYLEELEFYSEAYLEPTSKKEKKAHKIGTLSRLTDYLNIS